MQQPVMIANITYLTNLANTRHSAMSTLTTCILFLDFNIILKQNQNKIMIIGSQDLNNEFSI